MLVPVRKGAQAGYYPQQFPERVTHRDRYKPLRKEVAQDAPQRILRSSGLAFCLLLISLLLVSVGLISQYGRIIATKLQIHGISKEISELMDEKEYLQIEVKRLSSLERIEMIAKEDLGLQYPENRQWLRIAKNN